MYYSKTQNVLRDEDSIMPLFNTIQVIDKFTQTKHNYNYLKISKIRNHSIYYYFFIFFRYGFLNLLDQYLIFK